MLRIRKEKEMLRNKIRIIVLMVVMVISMAFGDPLAVSARVIEGTDITCEIKEIKNTKVKSNSKKQTKKKKSSKKKTVKVKVKKKNKKKTAKYSESDLRLLSALIFCEAGGDYYGCYAGKKAVGIVVMNRIKSNSFPNDLAGVIYQRGQFSCTGSFLNSALAKYDSNSLGTKCIQAAKEVLSGDTCVEYNGTTTDMKGYLFFSRYVSGARLQIEGHQFK